jgi:hypothetical protein
MGLLDFLNPDYLRDSLIQKGWERKKANVAAHYYGLALEQVIGIFWKEQWSAGRINKGKNQVVLHW